MSEWSRNYAVSMSPWTDKVAMSLVYNVSMTGPVELIALFLNLLLFSRS